MLKLTALILYNINMSNFPIILIAHNLRSSYNVGSIFRIMDGLGLKTIYLTGNSPYPITINDNRLHHIAINNDRQIRKTSLGAEKSINYLHHQDIIQLINQLKIKKYQIIALEQTTTSINLIDFRVDSPIALIIGNEITGIDDQVLEVVDQSIEIPMQGLKESFNVSSATSMTLFYLKYRQDIINSLS